MGDRVYGARVTVESTSYDNAPEEKEAGLPLGRNLNGCRIGFDLGASDRKCAAVIDGKVVFTEEVAWTPAYRATPSITTTVVKIR